MGRLRYPLLALALTALLGCTPAAMAAAPAPTESYTTLLSQIAAKKGSPERVTAATVDKADHHVRVTLANGQRPLVSYPAADDKQLVDNLLHHDINVIYSKKKALHHTLRYIAAGVVVVLLLIGGGVWFYTRGRPDAGTDSDTPAAPSA
jgi:ATP-dependent Zn protease